MINARKFANKEASGWTEQAMADGKLTLIKWGGNLEISGRER